VLFNVYLRDLMTCHKVIRTDVFRALPLRARGFDIEPEIAARLIQRGEQIFEVPVHYKARPSDQGKKLTAKDGFRVLARMTLNCNSAFHIPHSAFHVTRIVTISCGSAANRTTFPRPSSISAVDSRSSARTRCALFTPSAKRHAPAAGRPVAL